MPHTATDQHQDMQQCIRECTDCHATCTESVRHCLTLGGSHASPQFVAMLLTCARICETNASAMLLDAEQHTATCVACATVCRACAEDCRALGDGDERLRRCAECCDRCADWCERMARAA
jgi:hypothetical protein